MTKYVDKILLLIPSDCRENCKKILGLLFWRTLWRCRGSV